jgi:hypothetical protein
MSVERQEPRLVVDNPTIVQRNMDPSLALGILEKKLKAARRLGIALSKTTFAPGHASKE